MQILCAPNYDHPIRSSNTSSYIKIRINIPNILLEINKGQPQADSDFIQPIEKKAYLTC